MGSAGPGARVAWRQSLGAGLLLGLALGCGWLAHWTVRLYPRLLLAAVAALLALVALAIMVSAPDGPRASRWRRRVESGVAGIGLPYVSALLILALAAITSGNNLLYLIVSGLLAALAVSAAVAALNLSGMELRFQLPDEIYAGQAARVEFRLLNAKRFWPAYSLTVRAGSRPAGAGQNPEPAEMTPVYFGWLGGGRGASGEGEIVFPRRGRYRGAQFELTTRFPFGLVHKRRRFQAREREPDVLVYPAPVAIAELPHVPPRPEGELVLAHRGEGHDLYRIRDHQAGDSARQVHWKASARAGALRVREFSEDRGPRLRLRLSLAESPGREACEAALARCAGWVLALDRPEVWLEFWGENRTAEGEALFLPLAEAAQLRRAILEYLALVDPSRGLAPPPAGASDLQEIAITR
jgi:hypothetical protein